MTPRRLPLRPDSLPLHLRPAARVQAAPVALSRKALAITMHVTGLALFGIVVVWPVVSPIASGELAQEFRPALQALAGWVRSYDAP